MSLKCAFGFIPSSYILMGKESIIIISLFSMSAVTFRALRDADPIDTVSPMSSSSFITLKVMLMSHIPRSSTISTACVIVISPFAVSILWFSISYFSTLSSAAFLSDIRLSVWSSLMFSMVVFSLTMATILYFDLWAKLSLCFFGWSTSRPFASLIVGLFS